MNTVDMANTIRDCLCAEDGLMGPNKLVQKISSSVQDFHSGEVSSQIPAAIYLFVSDDGSDYEVKSAFDNAYLLQIKIVCKIGDTDDASERVANAARTVKQVLHRENANNLFQEYYTVKESTIFALSVPIFEFEPPDNEAKKKAVFYNGSSTINVRVKEAQSA